MTRKEPSRHTHGSIKSYSIGFGLSVIITLIAYTLVARHVGSEHAELTHQVLSFAVLTLAITQLCIQAIFFLHLGSGTRPRWNLTAFLFMLLVVFIVVAGSIWIMASLDYNMTPSQVEDYIFEEERIDPR